MGDRVRSRLQVSVGAWLTNDRGGRYGRMALVPDVARGLDVGSEPWLRSAPDYSRRTELNLVLHSEHTFD